MGLRFPIPQTIQQFCKCYSISPSQLLPNSYAILLSLGVLIKYFGLKICIGLLRKIVHVKRVGPGRFYVNPKPEYQFLGGHPSSHKGWPNRFSLSKLPSTIPGLVTCHGSTILLTKPYQTMNPTNILKTSLLPCQLSVLIPSV